MSGSVHDAAPSPGGRLDQLAVAVIAWWDKLRQHGPADYADRYVRQWLFEYVPKTALGLIPAASNFIAIHHADAMIIVAAEIDLRRRTAESYSVLTWVKEKYACHPKPEIASSTVIAVTRFCHSRVRTDKEHFDWAVRILRALIDDAAGRPLDIRVERALAYAMSGL